MTKEKLNANWQISRIEITYSLKRVSHEGIVSFDFIGSTSCTGLILITVIRTEFSGSSILIGLLISLKIHTIHLALQYNDSR